jgi:hypothetical protein
MRLKRVLAELLEDKMEAAKLTKVGHGKEDSGQTPAAEPARGTQL